MSGGFINSGLIGDMLLIAYFLSTGLLVLYFPVYVKRFVSRRREAVAKGLSFKPGGATMFMYLWTVAVVVALPGAVALPGVLKFATKSKQSEAKQNLGAIFFTQIAYFGEYNTYAGRAGENGDGAFADLNWLPEGDTNYAYYAGDDVIAPTKPYVTLFRAGKPWPFSIKAQTSKNAFTAIAIGNHDQDQCPDLWTINDAKVLTNVINDDKNLDQEGVCPDCPCNARLDFLRDESLIMGLMMICGVISLSSPAMIIVMPLLVYRLAKERRLYHEAVSFVDDDAT